MVDYKYNIMRLILMGMIADGIVMDDSGPFEVNGNLYKLNIEIKQFNDSHTDE